MKYPCDQFAALMAHSLNDEELSGYHLDPGALYAAWTDALAMRYAESLLHHPVYAWRMSKEEAASRYFEVALERGLMLTGNVPLSVSHRLLESMCQRGQGPVWGQCEVRRSPEEAHAGGTVESLHAGAFRPVAARLAALPATISKGSASPTLQARSGPVRLAAGVSSAIVPEELSTWDALRSGPDNLNSLSIEDFNKFCGLLIDCLRTANRPFQELLNLRRRLCPFDWIEELGVSQVRGLRRMLEQVKEDGAADSPESWAQAWERCPVPGFKSAQALWQSELGLALREVQRGVSLEPPGIAAELAVEDADCLAELEFRQQLELMVEDGVLHADEAELMMLFYQGAESGDVESSAPARAAARRRGLGFKALLEDIRRRIARWHGPHGEQEEAA